MQDTLDERDAILQAYEPNLLHRHSVHMARNGLLDGALPRPAVLSRSDMAHCYAVILDLCRERVLIIDSLKERDSVYNFCNAGPDPDFTMKTLVDILLHTQFPQHSSGSRKGWLLNCRMMHANYPRDSECFKHALALCQTTANMDGEFDERWEEAGSDRQFRLLDSKVRHR